MAQQWKKLGKFLKEKRLKNGLSQGLVARKLRYRSPQFVSNWERGISSPPVKKINQLINMYGISRKQVITIMLDETKKHLETNINYSRSN